VGAASVASDEGKSTWNTGIASRNHRVLGGRDDRADPEDEQEHGEALACIGLQEAPGLRADGAHGR
jgi:hypothetical protein